MELKALKNELYQFLDRTFSERASRADAMTADAADDPPRDPSPLAAAVIPRLSDRAALNPPHGAPIPFVTGDPARLSLDALAHHLGFWWLPLPPVMIEDRAWLEGMKKLAAANPDERLAVGLNNVSHLALASELEPFPNAWFFADFFLYCANEATLRFLRRRVPRLLFAYEWLEGGGLAATSHAISTVRLSPGFSPPLFTSLGCFTRHATGGGRCQPDCPEDFSSALQQGRNRFQVIVRDCVTYLFKT